MLPLHILEFCYIAPFWNQSDSKIQKSRPNLYFLTSAKIRGGWARFQSEFYQFGTGLNPLASLRLVSPGAVTESVALFLVIVLKSEINDLVMIHFQPLRLSSSSFVQCLLNSAAKKYLFSLGCHPPWWCHPGCPPSLVMPLTKLMLYFWWCTASPSGRVEVVCQKRTAVFWKVEDN